jgi:predicted unusual protein kinase regulating ubiquinone biosynthesis (AarF/ABC1/UbiB family)
MATIEAALGRPVGDVYVGLSADTPPIAAASLGQVYRCQLKAGPDGGGGGGGQDVAVKVQRPDT